MTDALMVMMQDLLTPNYALRGERHELTDGVRRSLGEKAKPLA